MSHSHLRSQWWEHVLALASCWSLFSKDSWRAALGTKSLQPFRWERDRCSSPFFIHQKWLRKGLGDCGKPLIKGLFNNSSLPRSHVPGLNKDTKTPIAVLPQGHKLSVLLQRIKLPCWIFPPTLLFTLNSLCLAALSMFPGFPFFFYPPTIFLRVMDFIC